MNISLTPELEKLISGKVATGRYHSASEVVREALRLLEERDQDRQLRLEQLRKLIDEGIQSIERGEVGELDIGKIKAEGRRRLAAEQGRLKH